MMSSIEQTLAFLPDTAIGKVEISCCGMTGAFYYDPETYKSSWEMGEMALAPSARGSDEDAIVVAGGTLFRLQINDNTDSAPMHVARLLNLAWN